ncbi:MAG: cytidylate kinase [Candidatus Saccharibacteria bacterium]|nr:cytidylate kinase [Candidatus Saccharibacteria bacterium]
MSEQAPSPEKKHIITIGGRPGSGKSTTSKAVAAELGFDHYSSGDRFRAIGAEHQLDLLSANKVAENDSTVDFIIDGELRDIGEIGDRIVIDSRMAWHWIPQSFKVYLDLDTAVAARRILAKEDAKRASQEKVATDPEEYAKDLDERTASEKKRYDALYGVNPYDISPEANHYDLIVDTAQNDADHAAQLVIDAFRRWIES